MLPAVPCLVTGSVADAWFGPQQPGVGKTAIVEGLATRIIHGDVPDSLKGKKVIGLDLGESLSLGNQTSITCTRLHSLTLTLHATT